ncbi:oxidative stress-induced growth inhibitor 2 [Triplophysa dalaica]|uniref:oxidative stress-induced growth inhibitor 2 n=1 Tax=Triplophysa dalaica TaxID=1582913 RepID=UPI0024E00796|nr:oxidative stress-induced growth inhibitor 2 [Triplophysa dalaica]XP_056618813.1 oxidative stress-induced growth inhibitor 2 [Triplophysa dalaica]XP_056618814.1 oxidative stress-induced growth inhibitor 2 [Triplophysa dalaica]XP_056618815.1 oxidative stress-induced growth inhibitor 2 [Triplophysa dalaica]
MPLLAESSLLRDCARTVPVVIIGNGPSGICLSYLLSGYTPYLDPVAAHPNTILFRKLQESKQVPITDQDLEYLCEGLEGRSGNPVAVLFDTLLHPNADLGFEFPSLLQWRLEKKRHIPHLVLGKATPGGAWHAMEGSMLTISLGIWMELPGVNYRDLTLGKRRGASNDRATPEEISSYYKNYVTLMSLQKNFVENTYVTSVQKLHRSHENSLGNEKGTISDQVYSGKKGFDHCKKNGTENGQTGIRNGSMNEIRNGMENTSMGEIEQEKVENRGGKEVRESFGVSQGLSQGLWEVRGYQQFQGDTNVPFSLFAENVVLATGASDSPARLVVEGEDLPYVFHNVRDLGVAVSCNLGPSSDPVLVVGAGLSAADAVLCALNHGVPVLHAFRKRADDPGLIFKQLPKTLYPEYHRVYNMMCSQAYQSSPVTNTTTPSPSLLADYTSFPEHCVLSFQPDMHCVMKGSSGVLIALKVSMVLVLIGSCPNLFFLKEQGQYLGSDPSRPISCKQNPIDINPYTFECNAEPGLFAMGPLIGDNFVRFLKGGALGIASCLLRRLKQMNKKNRTLIGEEGGRGREGSRGGGGFV